MTKLKRSLGKIQTVFFGVGAIVGAGIYALVGKIGSQAGTLAPFSLLLALFIAALTAYSYGQLVILSPKAAGEAEYVQLATGKRWLSLFTGWSVVLTGIVSCSTMVKAFGGYMQVVAPIPRPLAELGLILSMTLLAAKGIKESIFVSVLITVIEVGGILLVSGSGMEALSGLEPGTFEISAKGLFKNYELIAGASFLAFYAFIGFEDMVNMAEEIKKPKAVLPQAIAIALMIAGALYLFALLTALATLSPDELASSPSPMADIYKENGGNPKILGLIGLLAITNGAIAQILMGSRVLYGMRHKTRFLRRLSDLGKKTRTPAKATFFIGLAITLFTLFLPIEKLAELTSLIILIVFSLVNLSLYLLLKKQKHKFFAKSIAIAALASNLGLGILGFFS